MCVDNCCQVIQPNTAGAPAERILALFRLSNSKETNVLNWF